MATSEKRIAANRQNAMRAKGPVTPGGKANSRRNALKHGLTGAGVVLPAEEEAELAAKTAEWVAELKPIDDREHRLIRRTVLAGMRLDRVAKMEMARRIRAAARALSCWAEDRRVAAEELATKLARQPALVSRQLGRTLQGCELLLDRWRGLLRTAEAGTAWDEARRARALDLLGVPAEDREHHPRVHDRATAEELAAVARAEIEHLEGRRDGVLEDDDEADRLLVETGLAFDDSPTARRLWGYERTNSSIFLRGVQELQRRRAARGLGPTGPRPPVAATLRMPAAPTDEPDDVADGTPSVPPTAVATAVAVTIAAAPRLAPAATTPPPSPGNRRQRRARQALARRRG
ncbi:MAG TPA: hypothetical protein VG406_03875 [Isosphaeraceae bacterium]|jgi:hypothetical protein|nr:hypothetical protein [Isosphaeraceae bacterium]